MYEDDADGERGVYCALGPERLTTLLTLLKDTEILLRAEHVELLYIPWSWKKEGFCEEHRNLLKDLEVGMNIVVNNQANPS
jgi:hypothetical protein